MTFCINQVGIESAEQLSDLFAKIFPNKPNLVSFLNQPQYKAWIAYAAEVSKPIGFILVQHVLDEAEIIDMGVVTNHWRCGIAKAMLHQVVSTLCAAEVKKVFLEVDETNQPAIQLYKQFGFAEIGHRKGYYYIDYHIFHDAVNMCLNLDKKPILPS